MKAPSSSAGEGARRRPTGVLAPREHLLDEMRRHLGPASAGTRRTKASFLTAEGQQHLVRTGVTAQAHKAVSQDAALQVGIKCLGDISGQAFRGEIGRESDHKGLQVLGDDLVEKGATGVSRLVDGRYHIQTSRRQRLLRSPTRPMLHICALYHGQPLSV